MNASATEGIHETFNGRLRNKRNSWNFQWALAQSKTLKMPFCFEHLGICQINGSNFANPTDINPFCNIQRWGASGASPRSPVIMRAKTKKRKKKKKCAKWVCTRFPQFLKSPPKSFLEAKQGTGRVYDTWRSTLSQSEWWSEKVHDSISGRNFWNVPSKIFPQNFQGKIFSNNLGEKI